MIKIVKKAKKKFYKGGSQLNIKEKQNINISYVNKETDDNQQHDIKLISSCVDKKLICHESNIYSLGNVINSGGYNKFYSLNTKNKSDLFKGIRLSYKVLDRKQINNELKGLYFQALFSKHGKQHGLHCPYIAEVFDYGIYEYQNFKGVYGIIENMKGGDLYEKVKHYEVEKNYFTDDDIIYILIQILEGVFCIHQNRYIHLDLKLQNIVLENIETYDVKIIDFGFITKLEDGCDFAKLDNIRGTIGYMAPELFEGKPCLRSDIWSIGMILFFLLFTPTQYDKSLLRYLNKYKVVGDKEISVGNEFKIIDINSMIEFGNLNKLFELRNTMIGNNSDNINIIYKELLQNMLNIHVNYVKDIESQLSSIRWSAKDCLEFLYSKFGKKTVISGLMKKFHYERFYNSLNGEIKTHETMNIV